MHNINIIIRFTIKKIYKENEAIRTPLLLTQLCGKMFLHNQNKTWV